jgi:photosystem II stability/assembly factor-like uncharacterized protein
MKKIVLLFTFIMTSYFGFAQWVKQNVPGWSLCVYFADNNTGYVGGNGGIHKTTNSGTNWVKVHSVNDGYFDIFFTSPLTGYATGCSGLITKTTDGGNSWVNLNSGINQDLMAIDCPAVDTCYIACSGGEVIKSTNGGQSWQTIYNGSNHFFGVDFIDSKNGYVVGEATIKTTDGGNNWTLKDNRFNSAVSFVNINTGYAISAKDTVRKTTNGGNTWRDILTGCDEYFTSIQALSENFVVVACTTFFSLTVVKTTNGGDSWEIQKQLNDSLGANHIFFTDENNGWVVGDSWGGSYTVYHTTNGGNWISSDNSKEIQLDIYPNPATNKITIHLQDAGRTLKGFGTLSGLALTICNLQGQTLLQQNLTQNNTEIDISVLQPGIYFVCLLMDAVKVKTEKIIKY